MFGKKISAPIIPKNMYANAVARERVWLKIIAARKTSVKVPSSAPMINGRAFFKLINLETARGTKRPIVMLDEKTIPVNTTPIKYALYFESKCLFMNFFAFFSPPKTSIIDFPIYFNVKIKITNPISNKINLLLCPNKKFTIGEVRDSTKLGIFNEDIFGPIIFAQKKEILEIALKEYSNMKITVTSNAL